jgi:membrane associated rhomboid family serine protease
MIPIRDYNPTNRQPYVTLTIIVVCSLIFVWQFSLDPGRGQMIVQAFGFIPALVFGQGDFSFGSGPTPPWTTLITSMFLHGSFMHLAGNMLYLWIFGNNIEDVMGHGRFIVFYLLCGLAAAMTQALPDMDSTIPMIGASGAISGILGAYLVLFPRTKVQVIIPLGFFMMRTIPAGWLLGLWIAFQVFSGISSGVAGGGIAWWAHVGGFVAGMALVHPFKRHGLSSPDHPRRIEETKRLQSSGRSRMPDSPTTSARRKSNEAPTRDEPTVQRRRDP